jgi:hypothetical protein
VVRERFFALAAELDATLAASRGEPRDGFGEGEAP